MTNVEKSQPTCCIVGAGISGLSAARALAEAGVAVTVLDKGRGVGGRMSTRRMAPGRADHGAQAFPAVSDEFNQHVQSWVDAGVITVWTENLDGIRPVDASGPYYIGVSGMNSLPKYLADGLDIRVEHRVTALERSGQNWHLNCENGARIHADAVLLTMPVPQIADLLKSSGLDTIPAKLQKITYQPCFALMGTVDQPLDLPEFGAKTPDHDVIKWIADNETKGISSDQRTITIHSTERFAVEHLEESPNDVTALIQSALAEITDSRLDAPQLHRWRYSQVSNYIVSGYLSINEQPLLIAAGDGFGGAGIEAAFFSGRESAHSILRTLSF